MKYRKKPVVIEAVQWTGKNHREMFDFLENRPDDYITTTGEHFYIDHDKVQGGLIIKTPEGEQPASIGDFIVKGVNGEFHPCEPDVFSDAFGEVWEPVDEKEEADNADETVRALRLCADDEPANCINCPGDSDVSSRTCSNKLMANAAGLIESMQTQLADYHHISELVDGKMAENQRLRRINENLQEQLSASRHRERAAVEDLETAESCITCEHDWDCEYSNSNGCSIANYKWRGPQEAGKGETE